MTKPCLDRLCILWFRSICRLFFYRQFNSNPFYWSLCKGNPQNVSCHFVAATELKMNAIQDKGRQGNTLYRWMKTVSNTVKNRLQPKMRQLSDKQKHCIHKNDKKKGERKKDIKVLTGKQARAAVAMAAVGAEQK